MSRIVLIGGGGHCKSCIDVIEQEQKFEIVGVLDKVEINSEKIFGYNYLGTDDDIDRYVEMGCLFLITVGQIKTASIRQKISDKLIKNEAKMATVISPRAYVSKHASIGKGTIIMHDALVNASASIGENCIINSKALVEHDVNIGGFCHISTSAVVNGGVKIADGTFYGSNAVCKEGAETNVNDFINAGSVYKGIGIE